MSIEIVAKHAGVSAATVSRVLNGKPGFQASDRTRKKITTAAMELGYVPNRMARSMAGVSSKTIGVMVSGLENPFFVTVMEALERHVVEHGYQVMLGSAPSVEESYSYHGSISGWPVDGVLMWAFEWQQARQFLGSVADDLPVVYLGYPRTDGEDFVAFNQHEAGRIAARHLIDLGHRRVSFVTPYYREDGTSDAGRYVGCRDECIESNIAFDMHKMPHNRSTRAAAFETGMEIAKMDPAHRPRALVCVNDVIALGVMHGMQRAGLRVPKDAAVVGLDGIEEGKYDDVSLTSVEMPVAELASLAVARVMARLKGSEDAPTAMALHSKLRVGGSTVDGCI